MKRNEQWKRISALAGLDENGGILPPAPGTKVSTVPSPWWKTNDYAAEIERDGYMVRTRTVKLDAS